MVNWFLKLLKFKKYPKRVKIGKSFFLIPSPFLVKKLMQKPKKGKLISTEQIFKFISKKYPKKTLYSKAIEIFIWGWADNYFSEYKNSKFPFWRTINKNGALLADFPGGKYLQASYLRNEGHVLIRKGKDLIVKNFSKKLIKL
ncbi:MAG: hypothetical protein ACK4J0_03135 [Candidatus Anstonellaceae archaeon]